MYKNYIKRILDIILSIVLIIILSPIFIISALLVFISLGKPIIFKQTREGKNKKPYTMYKFRTMNFNENMNREDRMTPITSFLDKYKFNELPQLLNVLKGDMSLVGPRPFIPGDPLPKKPCKERYQVKPGMTGLSQITKGRYITHEEKLECDIIYTKKISFLFDLKIIILTPITIIKYR